jgi:AraC family transcriptional regulator
METMITQGNIGADGGALIEHAILPPHQPDGFTSTTDAGSIGISFTGHRRAVRRYAFGPTVEADIPPGASFVTGAGDLVWLQVSEPSESLEIYPPRELIRAVAEELGGSARPTLPDVAAVADPVIWGIAASFRAALLGGRSMGDLDAEVRLRLLLRHLLTVYGGLTPAPRFNGRLDERRLSRVVEFVEERLEGRLALRELAEVAALSPFHFLRAFRRATGITPHAYVTARRMERAQRLLLGTDRPVLEIATRMGYANPAHVRRAFRLAFGVAPGQIRRTRTSDRS